MGEDGGAGDRRRDDRHPWWLRTVVYGIQVSAFADADGDGLGDLRGIAQHLDHVASLGVACLWLAPTYVSSDRDNGYDDRFGGDAALDDLVRAAGQRGQRVVLELVGNHTSDQRPWFLASRRGIDVAERRRYVWRKDQPPEPRSPGFPGEPADGLRRGRRGRSAGRSIRAAGPRLSLAGGGAPWLTGARVSPS